MNPTKKNRAALEAKLHLMHQTRKNIPFTKEEVAGIRPGEFAHSTAMITRIHLEKPELHYNISRKQANDMVRRAHLRWRTHVKNVGLATALESKRNNKI